LRILLLMSLKWFYLCLLLCFIGVGSDSHSEGFLDIASRIVYQADTLRPDSRYRNVIHAHREDSENGVRLKLRVIETVCSTERALFIGYVYSYNCPNSNAYSSIKCLLTMNNNRTNIVLACNYLRVELDISQLTSFENVEDDIFAHRGRLQMLPLMSRYLKL
ncbi:hypothetical protein T07_3223, partial [Trichinella nelsoni]